MTKTEPLTGRMPSPLRDNLSVRLIRWMMVCVAGFLITGCGAQAMDMNVVVFNYWPRAMADVYVDGQHVGAGFGAYGPGGTGGSIACCSAISAGKSVEIKWMLGGGEDDPLTGKVMTASAKLEEIKPGARYLGVYLYPDGTVALDTARGIPDNRNPPEVR